MSHAQDRSQPEERRTSGINPSLLSTSPTLPQTAANGTENHDSFPARHLLTTHSGATLPQNTDETAPDPHPGRGETVAASKRRSRTISFGSHHQNSSMDDDEAGSPVSPTGRHVIIQDVESKAKTRDAQRVNDAMVYLDGPQVYTCGQCRTHLTSHDDIISKSFHGRHGRAYLFDQCVNVTTGTPVERILITGRHTVCDIFCKRCETLVGWTYEKAFDASQKYKEGKFIIEKINLHLEESAYYDVAPPAGERSDRWRRRSMSWGESNNNNCSAAVAGSDGPSNMVYEYRPPSP